jgi:sugar lactone lactonase YvrE
MRTHADLSALTRARTNGRCAASDGTLYVTSTCSDLQGGQERASGNIIRVAMDGTATIICDEDLMFPQRRGTDRRREVPAHRRDLR